MTKVMTLNLANYDDHKYWPQRLDIITSVIVEKQPDIIAVQEVRFNPDEDEQRNPEDPVDASTKRLYQNMGEQILYKLNQNNYYSGSAIVSQPAMFYKSMLSDVQSEFHYYPLPSSDNNAMEEWEGLSIISRLPILETGSRFLSITGTNDPNRRNTQYAVIQTKYSYLFVYNCHFSYDQTNFISNINETIGYLDRFRNQSCLLLGDLNMSPKDGMTGFRKFINSGFYDLWELLHPGEDGYTAPFDNPPQRIDYIWANSHINRKLIRSIELVATVPSHGIYASDHFGLLAEIDV